LPPLILRNGIKIDDPLSLALRFIREDGSYRVYDEPYIAQDNTLSKPDVVIANKFQARMGQLVVDAILRSAGQLGASLARIPPGTSLLASAEEIPWQYLEALYATMLGIPEVGLPRATKILHKKRPSLIPILDSVVEAYLRSVGYVAVVENKAKLAVELTRSYKTELDANANTLRCIRIALKKRGLDLTECRLLDYLWAYSGTYTPPFVKRA
jgi:hypothetical protein